MDTETTYPASPDMPSGADETPAAPATPHAWTPSQFKPRDLREARAHRNEPAQTSANEANRKHNVREYTLGEEIANSISHGVGALLGIAAIPILVVKAVSHGGGILLFAALVYTLTMLLEYTMSTLYHALAVDKAKRVFKVLDHSCIYLFIAGSYTPFCLISLADSNGTALDLRGALSCAGLVYRWVPAGAHPGHPCRGLVAAGRRRPLLFGRMHLLRIEEDPVHALHIPFVGCGGKRAAIPGDCAVCHVG